MRGGVVGLQSVVAAGAEGHGEGKGQDHDDFLHGSLLSSRKSVGFALPSTI